MSVLLSLPHELCSEIVFGWLQTIDLTDLDTSISDAFLRKILLDDIFSCQYLVKGVEYFAMHNINWMVLRKIRIVELTVSKKFFRKVAMNILNLNFSHVETMYFCYKTPYLERTLMVSLINNGIKLTRLHFMSVPVDLLLFFGISQLILHRLHHLSVMSCRGFNLECLNHVAVYCMSLHTINLSTVVQTSQKIFESLICLLISSSKTTLQRFRVQANSAPSARDKESWSDSVFIFALVNCDYLAELSVCSDSSFSNSDNVMDAIQCYGGNKKLLHIETKKQTNNLHFKNLEILMKSNELSIGCCYLSVKISVIGMIDDNTCINRLSNFVRMCGCEVRLTLTRIYSGNISTYDPFPFKSLRQFLTDCPCLKYLSIQIVKIRETDLLHMISGFNCVSVLDLCACNYVDTVTVLQILEHCAQLKTIFLSNAMRFFVNMREIDFYLYSNRRTVSIEHKHDGGYVDLSNDD